MRIAKERIRRRTSYRACSCSCNIVGGRGGGGILGRVDDWAHAQAELQIQSGAETEGSLLI